MRKNATPEPRKESDTQQLIQDQPLQNNLGTPLSQVEPENLSDGVRSFNQVKEVTSSFRTFNIACILINLLTTAFMTVFLGFLDGLLIAVFVVQFLFTFMNMIFFCVNDMKKQNWVKLRMYLAYIPFGILNLLFLYDFYRFFGQLESYNDQFSGGPKMTDQQTQLTEAYVTIWLTHFIITPFFQGLSYCIFMLEMGNLLEKK
eukprot:403334743